jgi:radical SAM protein with 4Fe4S-binding SPASM domain
MDRVEEYGGGTRVESTPLPVVGVGEPSRKRANQLRILEEEERKFRPVIYWYLSFRCNLACAHCSVHSSPWVDTSQDLTTEECMTVIDQMKELGVSMAILTGGEVTIRPDFLQIARGLYEHGIHVGLESNGLRFDKEFIELAQTMQADDMLNMTVSLDGGTRETHEVLRGPRSFDRTVRGLRLLSEHGVRYNIQCVINGSNIHTIPNLYGLGQELYPACTAVQWATLNPVGRGTGLVQELGLEAKHIQEIFQRITDEKGRYEGKTVIKVPPAMVPPKYLPLILKDKMVESTTSCQFPLLGVLPDGRVSICAVSRGDDALDFGNIREKGVNLKQIWEKTRMDMLRSRYLAAQDLQGICGDCVWKYTCKGSCRAWAYEEGDSFESPFPICKALDESGAFPKAYRLSSQNAAVANKYREMGAGCGCST